MQDINPLPDTESELAIPPAEPLAQTTGWAGDRKWMLAIIVSGLLHAAVAAAFLIAPAGAFDSIEAIQAEGADQNGTNVLGSALDDQGPAAVNIALVPDPQPPKPRTVQPAPPGEALQPASGPAMPEAVKESTRAPDILAAKTPGQDDPAASSGPAAPAIRPEATEATPAEPAQPPAPSAPAGSAGSSQATDSRGTANGDARDAGGVASKGKKQAATGNAMESHYSGEVQKKLARASRRVSKSIQAEARNNARVIFVVMADGSIGDLQLAESSGSVELDQFALKLVRQQAPFPPIPPETGRSSWVFKARIGPF
ncbi:energy transducer TonB [Mesorhizobium sp. B1-1-8]|uniref:energy transducer TonB family protein n=1 Tax=Mesorhizobium sp. B1-1-8 TaxID=2589976 RepID=UPI00112DAF49|nr:energy transducer TonB [Mesorhizobium sp. B1-1-8]UCI05050.1 TonB family protein [Mesorhizobium sp. B1-1-8]